MKNYRRDRPKHYNNNIKLYQQFKIDDKHRIEIMSGYQCYLSVSIHEFEIRNVSFSEINENKVINGTFSNIIYTDSNVIFNGIFVRLPNIHFFVSKLVSIENMLIESYREFCNTFKEPKFLIRGYFEDIEHIRFYGNDYVFKISGIWETDTHYGINYKFVQRIGSI